MSPVAFAQVMGAVCMVLGPVQGWQDGAAALWTPAKGLHVALAQKDGRLCLAAVGAFGRGTWPVETVADALQRAHWVAENGRAA